MPTIEPKSELGPRSPDRLPPRGRFLSAPLLARWGTVPVSRSAPPFAHCCAGQCPKPTQSHFAAPTKLQYYNFASLHSATFVVSGGTP
jgi:hypothetical protein